MAFSFGQAARVTSLGIDLAPWARGLLVRAGLSLALLCLGAGIAEAQETGAERALPPEVSSSLANPQWAGSARMRFLTLDIYDARLWVGSGFKARDYAQTPLALELSYLRKLDGKAIAERSLKEMRRSGSFSPEQEQRWLAAMEQAFPDVKAGDRLTGLHIPGSGARFFFNGQLRASINDAEFSRYFFGIWLSENTSETALRTQLLARLAP